MSSDKLGVYVSGPVIELAQKVRAALEGNDDTLVKTDYGSFYVSQIELSYDGEVVGYLVPDEGDGSTLEFWTPARDDA